MGLFSGETSNFRFFSMLSMYQAEQEKVQVRSEGLNRLLQTSQNSNDSSNGYQSSIDTPNGMSSTVFLVILGGSCLVIVIMLYFTIRWCLNLYKRKYQEQKGQGDGGKTVDITCQQMKNENRQSCEFTLKDFGTHKCSQTTLQHMQNCDDTQINSKSNQIVKDISYQKDVENNAFELYRQDQNICPKQCKMQDHKQQNNGEQNDQSNNKKIQINKLENNQLVQFLNLDSIQLDNIAGISNNNKQFKSQNKHSNSPKLVSSIIINDSNHNPQNQLFLQERRTDSHNIINHKNNVVFSSVAERCKNQMLDYTKFSSLTEEQKLHHEKQIQTIFLKPKDINQLQKQRGQQVINKTSDTNGIAQFNKENQENITITMPLHTQQCLEYKNGLRFIKQSVSQIISN